MHWQTAITWLAIGAACLYLTRRFIDALRDAKTGCAGGCGCSKANANANAKAPSLVPPEALTIRRR